jgi:hypothetical protein
MDAELNSEKAPALGETGGQSQVCESPVARSQGSEASAPAAGADAALREGALASAARDEGRAKEAIAQPAEPSFNAEKGAPTGKTGGSAGAAAPFAGAAVDPLKEASAALDDRDYATAQRLFAASGRNDVAEAIRDALAALDRQDYAKAHGLFEALGRKSAAAAPAKGPAPPNRPLPNPAASAAGPILSSSRNEVRQKPATSPLDIVPPVDAAYRRPSPQAEKTKPRRLKPVLLGTGVALIVIFGLSAIYGSPLNWTFPTTRTEAIAGLSSGAGVLEADLKAITGQSAREQTRNLNAALAQLTARIDRIEQTDGARLDQLSERVDQDSSSKFADIAARLDKLEKRAASPAAPAPESAEVVARLDKLERKVAVAAASASEIAGLATKLNKLERRAAFAGGISASPLPPAAPRQSSVMARAEPSALNETGRSEDSGPLLRDYSVEFVRDGVALVDTRYGPQQVAPGDSVPGAGRVLRIERRGGVWFVVTSRGVIGSGPTP